MNKEMKLSEHFSLQEMLRSGTAIRRGIANEPTEAAVSNLQALCQNVLEPLRRRFGRIIITSGYRSSELNKAVGGTRTSQHQRGEAADIYVSCGEMARRFHDFLVANTDYDQLIMEPRGNRHKRWIHVSYTRRRPNRHQALE